MKWPFLRILLVFLGFAAFSNAVFLPFVHDDVVFIQQNPGIGSFSNLEKVFIPAGAPAALEGLNFYYRPFLEFFYRAEYKLFGLEPAGYHLVNVLVHIFNGLLVFALLQELGLTLWLAWFVAALFLVHPAQTEAVTCVSGISNLLSVFFILAGLLLNLRAARFFAARPSSPGKIFFFALAVLSYVLALLTKESAAIFVGLFMSVEWILLSGGEHRPGETAARKKEAVIFRGIVFLFVTAGYFLWRAIVLPPGSGLSLGDKGELLLRVAAIPQTWVMYLRILVFPVDLHYYRNVDILQPLGFYPLWLILILVCGYLAVRRLPPFKAAWAVFGALWFLIAILPVSNFIPLVNEFSKIAAFEHFLYLPCIGFFIFALLCADHWLEQALKEKAWGCKKILFPGIIVVCLFAALAQNRYWRGEVPLFERMARFEKDFSRGWGLLAEAYYSQGQYGRAVEAYQKSLSIMRSYYDRTAAEGPKNVYRSFLRIILFGMANSYEQNGELEKAVRSYAQALEWDPGNSQIHNSLGVCYIKMHHWDMAQKSFEQSLRFGPKNSQAMNNLAICYIRAQRKPEAAALLRKVVELSPGDKNALSNLDKLLREVQGR